MNYTGQHRDNDPRPACTCNAAKGTPWNMHAAHCAITMEANARLNKGAGGSR